jgi:hypothetical protein
MLAACGLYRGAVDPAGRWCHEYHHVKADKFPLKDHLFNPQTVEQLAVE